ncbi:type II secretion system protein [Deinococcus radiopugnans]|uniref:Type II secretion system protein n=1 Tax=Deinococcus radiopugnans ATCC 19172 TaxID=585398 RepID=A0A5C4XNG2_9DEIO|nr:type II secretion system protein [Deinococcus radiopugnans ATCC 19172]
MACEPWWSGFTLLELLVVIATPWILWMPGTASTSTPGRA